MMFKYMAFIQARFVAFLLCPFFLTAHALNPAKAWATTFFPQSFNQSISEAPIILRGEVKNLTADQARSPEGWERIYTFVTLEVIEIFKGADDLSVGSTIRVRELGGEKDGMGMHVEGTAQFKVGENIVLFLKKTENDNTYDVHGMMMGKYEIQTDPTTQKETISGPGLLGDHQKQDSKPWTLDRLRQTLNSPRKPSSAPPIPRPSPAAPQLQTVSIPSSDSPSTALEEQENGEPNHSLIIILGMGGSIFFLIMLRKRKKKKK